MTLRLSPVFISSWGRSDQRERATDGKPVKAKPREHEGTWRGRLVAAASVVAALFVPGPLAAQTVDPCRPPIAIEVVRTACRLGTAEARVRAEAGAQISWQLDGGAITAGQGTATVALGFGAAERAKLSVTVSARGCTATGSVEITLREPFVVEALTVVPTLLVVNEPALLAWSYRGSDPVRRQLLRIGDAEVRLDPDVRSFTFTPQAVGALTVTLDASTLAGGRRRAVRSGDPLPPASACSTATRTTSVTVAPPCTRPTATVSGGGTGCGSVAIHATFAGTPPFSGRWSDDVPFSTTQHLLTRAVEQNGTYAITAFRDAHCDGTSTGAAVAEVMPEARATALTASRPAVQFGGDGMPLHFTFEDAVACTVSTVLNNGFDTTRPACTGSGTGTVYYVPANEPGRETVTLTVAGACGPPDTRSVSFNVCSYLASVTAEGPTTVPAGSGVVLRAVVPVTVPGGAAPITAGGPYTYTFLRCPETGQCQPLAVQNGSSDTYAATVSGRYFVRTTDREGCDSFEQGSVTVTIVPPTTSTNSTAVDGASRPTN